MSQALQTGELNDAAREFVKAGTPAPKVQSPVLSAPPGAEKVVDLPLAEKKQEAEKGAALNPSQEKATLPESEAPKGPKPKVPREKEAETNSPEVFVSMTFKLPQEIPAGLLRASADRKIKKIRPSTQQEIAAEAFSQWLKKNGYL